MTTAETKPAANPETRSAKTEGKAYSSVAEMVRDLADPDFADDFDNHLAERQLATTLAALRGRKGVTQAELADLMGCGQGKISKMEASLDADLGFGDIVKYFGSLGGALHITVMSAQANGADHIRFHVAAIKHELDQLVRVAGDDPAIGEGLEAFAIDQIQKLMKVVEDSLGRLPNSIRRQGEPVSIEVEVERGERLAIDAPKKGRVRKGTAKVVPET